MSVQKGESKRKSEIDRERDNQKVEKMCLPVFTQFVKVNKYPACFITKQTEQIFQP